jgi:exopolysaccharide biosynthesis polyprenyl glycosylphosphotransferase
MTSDVLHHGPGHPGHDGAADPKGAGAGPAPARERAGHRPPAFPPAGHRSTAGARPPAAPLPSATPRPPATDPVRLLPAVDVAGLVLVLLATTGSARMALLAAVGTVLATICAGLDRPRLTLSVLDDLPRLSAAALVGVAVGVAVSDATGVAAVQAPARVLTTLLAAIGVLVAARAVLYPLIRRGRRRWAPRSTVIVGSTALGQELGETLLARREHGLRPVGYLDEVDAPRVRPLPAPLLGRVSDLDAALSAYRVRCVIVAFGTARPAELVRILRTCNRHHCQVYFVPRFYELHQVGRNSDSVGGLPLIRMRPAGHHCRTWWCKRAIDVVVALLGLLVAIPVMACCALALYLEGGPGVLFRQERISTRGLPFTMFKLRTMRPASEAESSTLWSMRDDPRLGRLGRLLRASSLDELPQLFNILRGDMSLVGPRPERPYFVEDFSRRYPGYADRHRVPAGLTGWAAVNGLRGDTSIEARARHDNFYIENWSLWMDVKIMLRTVGAVLTRSGG